MGHKSSLQEQALASFTSFNIQKTEKREKSKRMNNNKKLISIPHSMIGSNGSKKSIVKLLISLHKELFL